MLILLSSPLGGSDIVTPLEGRMPVSTIYKILFLLNVTAGSIVLVDQGFAIFGFVE